MNNKIFKFIITLIFLVAMMLPLSLFSVVNEKRYQDVIIPNVLFDQPMLSSVVGFLEQKYECGILIDKDVSRMKLEGFHFDKSNASYNCIERVILRAMFERGFFLIRISEKVLVVVYSESFRMFISHNNVDIGSVEFINKYDIDEDN